MAYRNTSNINPNQILSFFGLRRGYGYPVTGRYFDTYSYSPVTLFGVGLLIGAGTALLLTPKSGRELRNVLSQQANQLGNSVRDMIPARQDQYAAERDAWENA
jgi:hypothetical protein